MLIYTLYLHCNEESIFATYTFILNWLKLFLKWEQKTYLYNMINKNVYAFQLDTIELYKLKTPHLRGDISQIPTPIYSSTPAPVKPVQKQIPRWFFIKKIKPCSNTINIYHFRIKCVWVLKRRLILLLSTSRECVVI